MAMKTVYIRQADNPEAAALLGFLKQHGFKTLKDVAIERVIWLEGSCNVKRLAPLFANELYETWSETSMLNPADGPIVGIAYKRAIVDPEAPSILEGAKALGEDELTWVKVGCRYQFKGVDESDARLIVKEHLFSPEVQILVDEDVKLASWKPGGQPDPVRRISFKGRNSDELERISRENSWYAPLSQMKVLQQYEEELGRSLTDVEIEIVAQSWSDHCYHTTWKSLGLLKILKDATLQINHPLIVSIFSDNAGGIEFYENWVITIKGETHNHPSAIAPFAGIATKHGGAIRDTIGFGKGALPIGGSTIMGTIDPRVSKEEVPAGALHPGTIVRESIKATAFYCNAVGIPMMYFMYKAHPNYPKCLALGHSIGLIPRQYALKDVPQRGDKVLLMGGPTGRDGLHGATASSTESAEGAKTVKEAASVPTGNPLLERKIIDVVPVLRDSGCIKSITDLGAGGISSAVGEMAAPTGVVLNLDVVPLKDPSLTAWEIMLSESQERMCAAVSADKVEEAQKILDRYGVESTVIGEFMDNKMLTVFWRGQKVVDMSMEFLWGRCPIDPMPIEEESLTVCNDDVPCPDTLDELAKSAKDVLSHYNCCDQSPAGFQFDSTVQGRTVIGPLGGITGKMPTDVFACAPLYGKRYGVMSTVGYNPFYGDVNPEEMVRLTIIDAVSKAVAAGADPRAIALCDNFYTPRSTPVASWHLTRMVKTAADLSIKLGMPFISGKDSSSGTFISKDGKIINVPYTFAAATLCRVSDVSKLVTKPFKTVGNKIVLVGDVNPEVLGGSIYFDLFNKREGMLPEINDETVQNLVSFWFELNKIYNSGMNPIKAASTIGEGGIFKKVFEMCYGSNLGASIDLAKVHPGRIDGVLFSEAIGCMLFEIDSNTDPDKIFNGYNWRVIGEVKEEPVIRLIRDKEAIDLLIDELTHAWEAPFKEVL